MIRHVPWQIVPFPYNANKERIFVTITNHAFAVKFVVVISSCTSSDCTFGKLKEIWEREIMIYSIEPEIACRHIHACMHSF